MRKNARKKVPCPICAKPFAMLHREQRYCSQSCGRLAVAQLAQVKKERDGKRCQRCKEVKTLSSFFKNASTPDGYKQVCKACATAERKERMARVKDDPERLERFRTQQRRACRRFYAEAMSLKTTGTAEEWLHRMDDPSKWQRMSKEERKEIYRAQARLKYLNDPEYRKKLLEDDRSRHQARPWFMLARKHRRDARLAGVVDDGSVTVEVLREAWDEATVCLYCGRELTQWNKSVEHMTPMSKGGEHTIRNVIIVCRLCNETKKSMWFDEWMVRLADPFRQAAHDLFICKYSGSCDNPNYCG